MMTLIYHDVLILLTLFFSVTAFMFTIQQNNNDLQKKITQQCYLEQFYISNLEKEFV